MKTTALIGLLLVLFLGGCAGAAARHGDRIERRDDRFNNRWERRTERSDRIDHHDYY